MSLQRVLFKKRPEWLREAVMAFYDEKHMTLVDEFEYRERPVRIFQTFRGATHCKIDHEPTKRFCDSCGTPVQPVLCFLAYIENNQMAAGSTPEETTRNVKRFIDFAEDGNHGGKRGGNRPPDETDEPSEPPEKDEGSDDEKEDEEGPNLAGSGHDDLPPNLEKLKKLGWPPRLKALAQKLTPKRVLPTGNKK